MREWNKNKKLGVSVNLNHKILNNLYDQNRFEVFIFFVWKRCVLRVNSDGDASFFTHLIKQQTLSIWSNEYILPWKSKHCQQNFDRYAFSLLRHLVGWLRAWGLREQCIFPIESANYWQHGAGMNMSATKQKKPIVMTTKGTESNAVVGWTMRRLVLNTRKRLLCLSCTRSRSKRQIGRFCVDLRFHFQ